MKYKVQSNHIFFNAETYYLKKLFQMMADLKSL